MLKIVIATFSLILVSLNGISFAGPIDLHSWTAESYPAVSGFGAGVWTVSADGSTVQQSVNGQPTIFYSDFNMFGSLAQGAITVDTGSDDDYFGFVIGFQPGDTLNATADYLLIDWKQATQPYNFGSPSNTPGSTAYVGLAVSGVSGIPTADELWGHVDFTAAQGGGSGGVQELQRAATLGGTGYADFTPYTFGFDFGPNNLDVWVNGALQLSINGVFSDGRLGFYNFSQQDVIYSSFTLEEGNYPGSEPIPEPASMILFGSGIACLLGTKLRRKR